MLLHELSHDLRIRRVKMIRHAEAQHRRCTQRPGETERVEEGQNAEQAVIRGKTKHLADLLHIGNDVEVREDDALRLPGATAGKNDRRHVVDLPALTAAQRFLDPRHRRQGQQQRHQPLSKARLGGDVFQKHRLHRQRQIQL